VSASAASELPPAALPGSRGGGPALSADERLARRVARGDPRAFATIFERHHQELYRYCRALVGDPSDAEDALQSTMLAALAALPGERRDIALRPWLFRVAHNEAISIIRRRRPTVDPEELAAHAIDGIDGVVGTRQRLRQLVSDLQALPERQRSALVMRELSGLSYANIGEVLGTTSGASRQLVYEARQALAELEAGREMDCAVVRRAISDREGKVMRRRRVRAHLRDCQGCRDFHSGISTRRAELHALCPPLPAFASAGMLASVLGAGGAAGGLTGGAAAGGLAGSGAASAGWGGAVGAGVATKAGAVVAAAAIGAGAAGVVPLPLAGSGGGLAPGARIGQPASVLHDVRTDQRRLTTSPADNADRVPRTSDGARASDDSGRARHSPPTVTAGAPVGQSAKGELTQASSTANADAPGRSASAPGQGAPRGANGAARSASAPGQGGPKGANGTARSASAPGQSGTGSGKGSAHSASSAAHSGSNSVPPGQAKQGQGANTDGAGASSVPSTPRGRGGASPHALGP
jgi:RNA polymerase sigma factor (sigma-70 family)